MIAASRLLYLLQRETEFPSVDWMLIIIIMALKVFFPSCFVITMWAWELLTLMHRFYVQMKVCFLIKC